MISSSSTSSSSSSSSISLSASLLITHDDEDNGEEDGREEDTFVLKGAIIPSGVVDDDNIHLLANNFRGNFTIDLIHSDVDDDDLSARSTVLQ